MDRVSRAAVGSVLGETGDVRLRGEAAQSARRVQLRWVGSRVAKTSEADHLRSNEYLVAVLKPLRRLDEEPGPVPAAKISYLEFSVREVQSRMHGRQVFVIGKDDLRWAPADRCLFSSNGVPPDLRSRFIELDQHNIGRQDIEFHRLDLVGRSLESLPALGTELGVS